MNRDIEQLVTHEVIPVVRAALKETAELRGAVQVLADRLDRLTDELGRGRAGGAHEAGRAGAPRVRNHPQRRRQAMNREQLERPFAPAQIRQRKGRNGLLDYVEGHSVIQRLNEALEGAWSFEIVHHEIREEEVLVLGKLTAEGIIKMQFGGSQVTRERESGALVSLGDDLKAGGDRLRCAVSLVDEFLCAERTGEERTCRR